MYWSNESQEHAHEGKAVCVQRGRAGGRTQDRAGQGNGDKALCVPRGWQGNGHKTGSALELHFPWLPHCLMIAIKPIPIEIFKEL